METLKIDAGEKPQVRITSIGGDLRLTGREGGQLEAHAPDESMLSVTKEGEAVVISCRSGCLVFLPAESRVQAETIGGDVRAIGLSGDMSLGTVGGDCSLRRMGKVTVDRIGGDLDARKIDGDFALRSGGGDGAVNQVRGSVKIDMLGGDFALARVEGDVEVTIGGDASVRLAPENKRHARVAAGGDLACRLPDGASATIKIQAGGDLQVSGFEESEGREAGRVLRIGKGEAEIDLNAGGDLALNAGMEGFADVDMDLGESIAASIEAKMADLDARYGARGSGFSKYDSDRIGERVRRVVSRSMRKAADAQKRATLRFERTHGGKHISFGPFEASAREPASEEERMSILRMLEQGKINIDEAENLLKALEGES